jgi:hypothetical protein
LNKKPENTKIDQLIQQVLQEEKPENVEQLLKTVQLKGGLPEKQVLEHILRLHGEGKIKLKGPITPTPRKIVDYVLSSQAYWYWTTIAISLVTTILVFTVPEDAYPIVYVRYVLGTAFVLWLPGYAFIKALFPTKVPVQTGSGELDSIERIALSIGMSLALVPIVGLLLNYTPWGIRLTPIVLSLLTLTTVFATAAIAREYQIRIKAEK